jgi:hypothetical protein
MFLAHFQHKSCSEHGMINMKKAIKNDINEVTRSQRDIKLPNAPLIFKMGAIFWFRANYMVGHFSGYIKGA